MSHPTSFLPLSRSMSNSHNGYAFSLFYINGKERGSNTMADRHEYGGECWMELGRSGAERETGCGDLSESRLTCH